MSPWLSLTCHVQWVLHTEAEHGLPSVLMAKKDTITTAGSVIFEGRAAGKTCSVSRAVLWKACLPTPTLGEFVELVCPF